MKNIFEVLLVSILFLYSGVTSANTEKVNLYAAGSFESGIKDLEVYRYPKFYKGIKPFRPAVLDTQKVISGNYSLRLPGIRKGGYKLVPHVFMVDPRRSLPFSMHIRSEGAAIITVEVFQQRKKIVAKKSRLSKGDSVIDYFFTLKQGKNPQKKVPVRLNIWISSPDDVLVDDIAVMGISDKKTSVVIPSIVTDSVTSVYGIGEKAKARVISEKITVDRFRYKILNVISSAEIESGSLNENKELILPTTKRGAFWIEIWTAGASKPVARRSYVVINKSSGSEAERSRYGIAMEEHGQRTMIDARLKGGELYSLARNLGAGNVRLFTPAMPDLLSRDGHFFDYDFLDHCLDHSEQNGLEPLLELGSNLPNRIPAWLKTTKQNSKTLDLRSGLRTKKLKRNFKKAKGGNYLDLDAYETYLEGVFNHIDGRVRYYEIWNEPGHKFTPDTYARIAKVTRKVQSRLQPDAKLLGFTSTKGKGLSVAREGKRMPKFLQEMLKRGADENIDILTYHSEHAFRFLGKKFDYRNEETGYVELIRDALTAVNKPVMDIWDTERGIAWTGHHENRADQFSGKQLTGSAAHSHNYLEVARRLPAIHAAAFASDVNKQFWFYMDSSTATIAKLHHRYGFFDAQLEPMPHIPVYDAMTEIIGDAKFERLIDMDSGTRVYLFSKNENVIALLYNWKEKEDVITYNSAEHNVSLLDIMGNPVNDGKNPVSSDKLSIMVSGWPNYLLIDNADVGTVEFK